MTALRHAQGARILSPVASPSPLSPNGHAGEQFKGLMALLAGIERALVDIDTGLSMHSTTAKNFNMAKAKEALSAGLADFRRGNAL